MAELFALSFLVFNNSIIEILYILLDYLYYLLIKYNIFLAEILVALECVNIMKGINQLYFLKNLLYSNE